MNPVRVASWRTRLLSWRAGGAKIGPESREKSANREGVSANREGVSAGRPGAGGSYPLSR